MGTPVRAGGPGRLPEPATVAGELHPTPVWAAEPRQPECVSGPVGYLRRADGAGEVWR